MYNIYGKVKYVNEDGVCQNWARGGWYIPYFKAVDSSSSPSKWSRNAYDIDPENEGYISFDLEDYDILTSEGSYRRGTDKIYLPFFWNFNDNSDKDINSTKITHMGFIDHVIRTGADADGPMINLTLAPVKKPKATFTLPADEIKTNTNISMSETSSLDVSIFKPTGCGLDYSTDIQHLNAHEGLKIFSNYKLIQTDFDWGDGSLAKIDKSGDGTTNNSHKYTTPGTYTVSINVKNGIESSYSKVSKQIKVKYNKPIVDFSFNSNNGFKGKEKVIFTNNTSNSPDNRESMYSYSWEITNKTIDDKIEHNGVQFSYSPEVNFETPGIKTITLKCHWNDGFEDKIEIKTKTLEIKKFNEPLLDFTWNAPQGLKGNNNVIFTNNSTDLVDNRLSLYTFDWKLNDLTLENVDSTLDINNVDFSYKPNYIYKSKGLKTITLKCHWNDGFEDNIISKIKTFTLNEFDIDINFNWDKICKNRSENVTFTSIITGDFTKKSSILWEVEDSYPMPTENFYVFGSGELSKFGEESPDNSKEILNNKTYSTDNVITNFHSQKNKNIKLIIEYFTGWETKSKELSKIYMPSNMNILNPTFSSSNINPRGRKENVVFTNTTNDIDNLQYYYDMYISDFFMIGNLDNPLNEVKDNSINHYKIDISTKINHKFQNISDNNVTFKTYFDNGWGRIWVEKSINIKPSIYNKLNFDFIWTPDQIINRDLSVEFINSTEDISNTIISCDWLIQDEYEIYNPNNPSYGLNTSNNTKNYINKEKNYKPIHKFQSNKNHEIQLTILYDDGFISKTEILNKTLITKDIVNIVPDFVVQVDGIEKSIFNPKEECHIISKSTENILNSIISLSWELNDRDFIKSKDNIVKFENVLNSDIIKYIWKYATKKPDCIENSTELEKDIKLFLVYDNGWNNKNIKEKIKNYRLNTNEIENLDILWKNLDFIEALDIYGKEKVEFSLNVIDNNNSISHCNWLISDLTYEDLIDASVIIENNNKNLKVKHIFLSPGNKIINVEVYFDDGFSNIYSLDVNETININKYLEPDFDFTWEDDNLKVGKPVKFTEITRNYNRPYSVSNKIMIDYYNDDILDKFDIDGDGIGESDYLNINSTWYNIFTKKENPLYIKLIGIWNNGWEEKQVEVVKSIVLSNILPSCSLIVTPIVNNKYKLNIELNENVDDIKYKFDIYSKGQCAFIEPCRRLDDGESEYPICSIQNDFSNEYNLILISDWQLNSEKWISMATPGMYKVIGSIMNEDNEKNNDEKYFTINMPNIDSDGNIVQNIMYCTRKCITGITKKYTYQTSGEKEW